MQRYQCRKYDHPLRQGEASASLLVMWWRQSCLFLVLSMITWNSSTNEVHQQKHVFQFINIHNFFTNFQGGSSRHCGTSGTSAGGLYHGHPGNAWAKRGFKQRFDVCCYELLISGRCLFMLIINQAPRLEVTGIMAKTMMMYSHNLYK